MNEIKHDEAKGDPVERRVRHKEPDYFYARLFMGAAFKSGDEGAIRLAAQLANAAPCDKCDYIWNKCRCVPNAELSRAAGALKETADGNASA